MVECTLLYSFSISNIYHLLSFLLLISVATYTDSSFCFAQCYSCQLAQIIRLLDYFKPIIHHLLYLMNAIFFRGFIKMQSLHVLSNLTYHTSLVKYSMPYVLCISYQLFGFLCDLSSYIFLLSNHLLLLLCIVVAYYCCSLIFRPYFSGASFMTCEDSFPDLGHLGCSTTHLKMLQKESYDCF